MTFIITFIAIGLCVIALSIGKLLTGKSRLNCKRCGKPDQDCPTCKKPKDSA